MFKCDKSLKNLLKKVFIIGIILSMTGVSFAEEGNSSIGQKESLVIKSSTWNLKLNKNNGSLQKLALAGSDFSITGNDKNLWSVWFLDKYEQSHSGPWKMGNNVVRSADAKLLSFIKKDNSLHLEYEHKKLSIKVILSIDDNIVSFKAVVKNLSSLPIQAVDLPGSLKFALIAGQNVFSTEHLTGVEFSSVKNIPAISPGNLIDGFFVGGKSSFIGFYKVQADDGISPFLPTTNSLKSASEDNRTLKFSHRSICYIKQGEQQEIRAYKIGRFKTQKAFFDRYVSDNFPRLKPLKERLSAEKFQKFSSSVLLKVKFSPKNGYKYFSSLIPKLPGNFIFHPVNYLRPTRKGLREDWDAFPNYFPPNPFFGTMKDFELMVKSCVKAGQLFMPRTSSSYWASKSEAGLKYGKEKTARLRLDGSYHEVSWALPGWCVSPWSKPAKDVLFNTVDKFKDMGSSLYFTNVIAVTGPWSDQGNLGVRYDAYPGAPNPALYYNEWFKLIGKLNKQLPMLTEGGYDRLMPYTSGFCHSMLWPWGGLVGKLSYMKTRGNFRGFRSEMYTYLAHQYVAFFPHNASGEEQNSIIEIAWSLINGYSMKYSITQIGLRERDWMWLRTLALVSDKLSSKTFGQPLLNYIRKPKGIIEAQYLGGMCIANFSDKAISVETGIKIEPNGFYFRSSDRKIEAGYFSVFKGYKLKKAQFLIIEYKETQIDIYAPLATKKFYLFFPSSEKLGLTSALRVTAQNETRVVASTSSSKGLLFEYEPFPYGPARFIPRVELITSPPLPVWLSAYRTKNNSNMQTELDVTIENLSDQALQGTLHIKSIRPEGVTRQESPISLDLGMLVNKKIKIKESKIKKVGSIEISLERVNKNILSNTVILTESEKENPPSPVMLKDIDQDKFPLILNWDMTDLSAQWSRKSLKTKVEQDAEGIHLSGLKSFVTIPKKVILKKSIYIEAIIQFKELPTSSEIMLVYIPGKLRGIELRYNHYFNNFRFLLVSKKRGFYDITNTSVAVEAGKWYHIVASYDGQTQILEVNKVASKKLWSYSLDYSKRILLGTGKRKYWCFPGIFRYLRIGGK